MVRSGGMKFAQQLKALEGSAAPEWRGKFIHYKELKKAIKLCRCVCLASCLWRPVSSLEEGPVASGKGRIPYCAGLKMSCSSSSRGQGSPLPYICIVSQGVLLIANDSKQLHAVKVRQLVERALLPSSRSWKPAAPTTTAA